jgi:steroid delta-isomerase-like uncharacterized protein
MSVDANKALIRRFYEQAWENGNVDVADEVFAPDYIRHDLRPTAAPPGPRGQKQVAAAFREAFPDLRFNVELVLGEGDYVAARWTATGTHSGPWGGLEPTGRSIDYTGVNIFRFENGRVAEIWNYRDDLGLGEQLGASVFAGAPPQT